MIKNPQDPPPPAPSLAKTAERLECLAKELKLISGGTDPFFDSMIQTCRRSPELLKARILKVAVAGSVKSGKSTLVNSLLGKEAVKRGAGVMTAVTTAIRRSEKRTLALVRLKSWDEINRKIRDILAIAPENLRGERLSDDETAFDFRRRGDREILRGALDGFFLKLPVTGEGIAAETLLIKNLLQGFEHLKDQVGADPETIEFSGNRFAGYKRFASEPAFSVFVEEIRLLLPGIGQGMAPDPEAGLEMEIADCQGCDSTDPAQVRNVIAYLESAGLILYCISSRTGLRKADIRFLNTISRLCDMKNVLFINNCDLSEHEGLDDLVRVENLIRDELSYITPDPMLFSFSALYNLFSALPETRLSARSRKRFLLWREEKRMIRHCEAGAAAFKARFQLLMTTDLRRLATDNPARRLSGCARSLQKKTGMMELLLQEEASAAQQAAVRFSRLDQEASRLMLIVENSLGSAVRDLVRRIEANIDQALVKDKARVQGRIMTFIKTTPIPVGRYRQAAGEKGFNRILYLMFREFNRRLDLFAINEIRPLLARFIAEQETVINRYFGSLLDAYRVDALTGRNRREDPEAPPHSGRPEKPYDLESGDPDPRGPDMDTIRKILGLSPPEIRFSHRPDMGGRTGMLARFGLGALVEMARALVIGKRRISLEPGLEKAAAAIRKKSLKTAALEINRFSRSLKKDYFSLLIEAATRDFNEKIDGRFKMYSRVREEIEAGAKLKAAEKKERREQLRRIAGSLETIIREFEKP